MLADILDVPADPGLNYVGAILLLMGLLLILSGLNILTIEKITMTPGRKTWMAGIVCALAGAGLLFTNSVLSSPQPEEKAFSPPGVSPTAPALEKITRSMISSTQVERSVSPPEPEPLAPPPSKETVSPPLGSSVSQQLKYFIGECWLASQNNGDFEKYAWCFAHDFRGVRRTQYTNGEVKVETLGSLAAWLEDRGRMFAKHAAGERMSVSIEHIGVSRLPDEAGNSMYQILFQQKWRQGAYCDCGEKILILRQVSRQPETFKIIYETMSTIKRLPTPCPEIPPNFDWPE